MIAKNNEIILKYKELIKNSKNDNEIATDDINTISLAYQYQLPIEEFIYCSELDYHEDTLELIQKVKKVAKNTNEISKKTYESLQNKENSVGLFAIIKLTKNNFASLENKEFLVVCDGLEIPGNLGTIYRTCDSAAVDGIIMVNSVTHPYNNKNNIASRGCNLLLPTWETSFEEASQYLLDHGYTIFLGEPVLGESYQAYDYDGKIAIVVGNERFGIDERWYKINSPQIKKVFIPMWGSNNSLNVSVAASILIYEAKMKKVNKIDK